MWKNDKAYLKNIKYIWPFFNVMQESVKYLFFYICKIFKTEAALL